MYCFGRGEDFECSEGSENVDYTWEAMQIVKTTAIHTNLILKGLERVMSTHTLPIIPMINLFPLPSSVELLISKASEAHWLVCLCLNYGSVYTLIIWRSEPFVGIQDLPGRVLLHLQTFRRRGPYRVEWGNVGQIVMKHVTANSRHIYHLLL